MHHALRTLPHNLVASFSGTRAWYHLAAIVLTFCIVRSGLDWSYFTFVYEHVSFWILIFSDIVGFIVPFALPITLLCLGIRKRDEVLRLAAWAIAQAAAIALIISSFYKALTGRVSPPHHGYSADISGEFQFGFMRENILGGWPSSHATVSFAIAMTLITLFPRSHRIKVIAILYALAIGIGVTFGFHWLSEFIAGALIGIAVGSVVGTSFARTAPRTNA